MDLRSRIKLLSEPSETAGLEGQLYYNSTDEDLYFHDNTQWIGLKGSTLWRLAVGGEVELKTPNNVNIQGELDVTGLGTSDFIYSASNRLTGGTWSSISLSSFNNDLTDLNDIDYISNVAYNGGTGTIDFTGIGNAFNSSINLSTIPLSDFNNDLIDNNDIDYISNLVFNNTTGNLDITGIGNAFNSSIDLSTFNLSHFNNDLSSGNTIYSADDSLASNRIISLNGNTLDIVGAISGVDNGVYIDVDTDQSTSSSLYVTNGGTAGRTMTIDHNVTTGTALEISSSSNSFALNINTVGSSATQIATSSTTSTAPTLRLIKTGLTSNVVGEGLEIQTLKNGTAGGTGLGGRITFSAETSTEGNLHDIGYIDFAYTNATLSSEQSEFRLSVANAGTLTERLSLLGTGELQVSGYGSGSITGTATYSLAVDASGNIIEEALAGGGSSLWFSNGTNSISPIQSPTQTNNIFLGFNSGESNILGTSGEYNFYAGYRAGYFQTDRDGIFIGRDSGYGVTGISTSTGSIGIGYRALNGLTTGNYNVAVGYTALETLSSGLGNVAIGYEAGSDVTTSSYSTFVGYFAGRHSQAESSIAIGYSALRGTAGLTTGANNVAIGRNSLFSVTTGSANLGVGRDTLYSVTTQTSNSAIGFGSGYRTIGSYNFFGGYQSGYGQAGLSTGNNNMGFGYQSMYSYTTARDNTGIGYYSLRGITEGQYNVGIGSSSLWVVTTGNYNTAVGASSLRGFTGNNNVGLGYGVGYAGNGSNNVYIGYRSAYNSTGSDNVFLGYNAGYNEIGSQKLYIANTDTATPLIYGEFDTPLLRSNANFEVNSTGYLLLALGTTAQRPTGATGMIRYNSTENYPEYHNGTEWLGLADYFGVGTDGQILTTDGSIAEWEDRNIFCLLHDSGTQTFNPTTPGTYKQVTWTNLDINESGFSLSSNYVDVPQTGYYRVTFTCRILAGFDGLNFRLNQNDTTVYSDSNVGLGPSNSSYHLEYIVLVDSTGSGIDLTWEGENSTFQDAVLTIQFLKRASLP